MTADGRAPDPRRRLGRFVRVLQRPFGGGQTALAGPRIVGERVAERGSQLTPCARLLARAGNSKRRLRERDRPMRVELLRGPLTLPQAGESDPIPPARFPRES